MPFYHEGLLRVAVASPRVTVADPDTNVRVIAGMLRRAEAHDVGLVVFPELCVTGYTCGDLFGQMALLEAALAGVQHLLQVTKEEYRGVAVVGLPLAVGNGLFNVAAVLHRGEVLGVVPKSYLPTYKEFYEHRWFASAAKALKTEPIPLLGKYVLFGPKLQFTAVDVPGLVLGVEICEDLWMPMPPSSYAAVDGATILVNLSASTELVGKAPYRRMLVASQSGRCQAAYLYAGSAVTESTTDVIFGGHSLIAENGVILAESERFHRENVLTVTEIDLERLTGDRRRQGTMSDALYYQKTETGRYVSIGFHLEPSTATNPRLLRAVDPHPFVPAATAERDERCAEVFHLQVAGLAKRLEVIGEAQLSIGISGGLDSTLALLVACQTLDLLKVERSRLQAFMLPGFGSTAKTKELAETLISQMGVTRREADIRQLCLEEMRLLDHRPFGIDLTGLDVAPFSERLRAVPKDKRHDLVFENVQARMRTNVLMNAGFVVGTGDLSELALGWCTYNGDQISMYNPNVGVPKTLVRFLIRWVADHHHQNQQLGKLLHQIADQVISPELLPTGPSGEDVQSTEASVGPYELQDFFLYYFLRFGFRPEKLLFLASQATFEKSYTEQERKQWLTVFLKRFFAHQFKRSCLPDGPKVGSVSLSPRSDWRMPSDASVEAWLGEQ
jgi:NAD+ synthase (glutamine-hydrolysing)